CPFGSTLVSSACCKVIRTSEPGTRAWEATPLTGEGSKLRRCRSSDRQRRFHAGRIRPLTRTNDWCGAFSRDEQPSAWSWGPRWWPPEVNRTPCRRIRRASQFELEQALQARRGQRAGLPDVSSQFSQVLRGGYSAEISRGVTSKVSVK